MDATRITFLVSAFATHAVVGYALVRGVTDADPRLGVALGLLPDADFLFPAAWGWPLVHRGITHTPLFAVAVVAVAYALRRDRTVALAVGLGIGSHLAIDSLSSKGIDWLFPLASTAGPGVPVHGPAATAVLWAASLGVLAWRTEGALAASIAGDRSAHGSDRSDPSDRQAKRRE
ncbi:membrane-bound metal-dependent hydrolase [Haloterrigena turkmenica DSM 5511]|uniref:Membrane-bound metal-dependent hydrolase n=1 Tax=Haloterrigena turkmenica (strain ATCC 51198 / DSM 5511 / JCM 9101 / NCIMB 13204 / VKM B-1734 / 4k) TaxID=543526 RepID=D2RQK7_HALTV|nr:metal-dependent hydrolase [Haloterrigena turkmenica]ADB62384.1 membrane-bound metal-dependent hydrolase [Haloterrigena turkmenica DSM 5511]